jgi:RHH-type proline utilization regulon transcriptional repressor/proline dehydrogenase/delta 1-pyrroline-5-carboxylate dehydrogenase
LVKGWKEDASKGVHAQFVGDFDKLETALQSYVANFDEEFDKEHDYFKIRGEDNIFRYLPLSKIAVRVTEEDTLFEVVSRILAAKVSGVGVHVSLEATLENPVASFLFENKERLLGGADNIVREDDATFAKGFKQVERIIYADIGRVPKAIFDAAAQEAKYIVRQKPMMEGRLELLNYFQEQSISHSYHRYGNLGARGL